MSHYLVTGGAGFIGSHLVHELAQRGERVTVLDNLSAGKVENLRDVWQRIQFIEGDIRDLGTVRRAVAGVDYVLHQAALRSVPLSIEDPATYHEVNASGTLNVLLAARDAKVRRVVMASSSSVYGDTERLPQQEDQPTRPISPYATTKLLTERYGQLFTDCYGLETVALRYFNVFGPRQDIGSQYAVVIPKFITAIMAGEAPPIHGDGQQTRDFTFVANVVEANLRAAVAPGVAGEVFNIACGQAHSVLELAERINAILGTSVAPRFLPKRQGDIVHTRADVTKARQRLGCQFAVSFDEGLRRTVEWFAAQRLASDAASAHPSSGARRAVSRAVGVSR